MENTELLIGAAAALRPLLAECAAQGLTLTEADLQELVVLRQEALVRTGRLEFSSGILPSLIRRFSRSPYVDRENFAATIGELQDAFYDFKTESRDLFSDEELLDLMEAAFNGPARGSTDLLCGWTLDRLLRWVRDPESLDEEDLL